MIYKKLMLNRAVTLLTEAEQLLVEQCAQQLRIIQSDASQLTVEQRNEYYAETIKHTFKGRGSADQRRLLTALLERFPIAGRLWAGESPAAEPVPPPPETPEILLEKFIRAAKSLGTVEREAFIQRLADEGLAFSQPAPATSPFEVSPELRQKLGLPAGQNPDPERLVQLLAALLQTLNELDRTAYTTLKEIKRLNGPRSFDLWVVAGQYLAGSGDNVNQALRPSAVVLAGLMAGILGGGKEFSRQFSQKYSPDAIEQIVTSEGKSGFMGPSRDERCWQKYQKLYQDIETPEALDRWLKECLAKFVELGSRGGR